jgi:hypothetical protein
MKYMIKKILCIGAFFNEMKNDVLIFPIVFRRIVWQCRKQFRDLFGSFGKSHSLCSVKGRAK